jgi:nicotinamidase-related amidase
VATAASRCLTLRLRAEVRPWKGEGTWQAVAWTAEVPPGELAFLICDVWDAHWCRAAQARLEALAPRIDRVARALRAVGVQVIHAPSDVVEAYAAAPARRRVLALPPAPEPEPQDVPEPPLPIDDGDGGCESDPLPAGGPWPWTRQHPAIAIADADWISADGAEVRRILHHQGIRYLVLAGVHTNMCILHRSFGIVPMTRRGVRCLLARDLTDAMYNPARPPYVPHDEGTRLVVQYIERHFCPTVLGEDLAQQAEAWR